MAILLVRGGWAPALVFGVHVIFEYVIALYGLIPLLDVPMHFIGGAAIGYLITTCFAALPATEISSRLRPAAQLLFTVSMTATAAILWELLEYTTDRVFGTRTFGNQYDTLLDLTLGVSGAAALMFLFAVSGRLGSVRPITGLKK